MRWPGYRDGGLDKRRGALDLETSLRMAIRGSVVSTSKPTPLYDGLDVDTALQLAVRRSGYRQDVSDLNTATWMSVGQGVVSRLKPSYHHSSRRTDTVGRIPVRQAREGGDGASRRDHLPDRRAARCPILERPGDAGFPRSLRHPGHPIGDRAGIPVLSFGRGVRGASYADAARHPGRRVSARSCSPGVPPSCSGGRHRKARDLPACRPQQTYPAGAP
jgi:hypothetical protein